MEGLLVRRFGGVDDYYIMWSSVCERVASERGRGPYLLDVLDFLLTRSYTVVVPKSYLLVAGPRGAERNIVAGPGLEFG